MCPPNSYTSLNTSWKCSPTGPPLCARLVVSRLLLDYCLLLCLHESHWMEIYAGSERYRRLTQRSACVMSRVLVRVVVECSMTVKKGILRICILPLSLLLFIICWTCRVDSQSLYFFCRYPSAGACRNLPLKVD